MDEQTSARDLLDRPISRKAVLALGAAATISGTVVGRRATALAQSFDLEEATVAQIQSAMRSGALSSRELVAAYLGRIAAIDRSGPTLNSIIEINPDALAIAEALDRERAAGRVRGPLHGVPVVLKDNVGTGDRMQTTAGSLALLGHPAPWDATLVRKLREAGAVIMAKTNLSEWANFRSLRATSGWSGRGGLTRSPYVLDRNACGSSSGSPVAVSANLTALGVGTETDGSIVCPSGTNGVVGIKPTLGLISRMGVVPISHSQDTAGPMGRTVADAAALLTAMAGPDPHDPATRGAARNRHDYTRFVNPHGLRGMRLGVIRDYFGSSLKTDLVMTQAIHAMRRAGAHIIDVHFPTYQQLNTDPSEFTVLLYDFKHDINKYLRNRGNTVKVHSLAGLIRFNRDHHAQELKYFDQSIFLLAEKKGPLTSPEYQKALATSKSLARQQGIDAVMNQYRLDALVAPTNGPGWTTDLVNGDHFSVGSSTPAAVAGYPSITVPAGFSFAMPIGVSFFGRAWTEPRLISIAAGFEHATHARRMPTYLPSYPEPAPCNCASH